MLFPVHLLFSSVHTRKTTKARKSKREWKLFGKFIKLCVVSIWKQWKWSGKNQRNSFCFVICYEYMILLEFAVWLWFDRWLWVVTRGFWNFVQINYNFVDRSFSLCCLNEKYVTDSQVCKNRNSWALALIELVHSSLRTTCTEFRPRSSQ